VPKVVIDNIEVLAPDGATVLEAAESAGIAIPHLCYLKGIEPQTSCLVCVVRINGAKRMVPSCATKVADGMVIESSSPDVHLARRTALELLLAEHAGECFAPCSQVCPAHLDIPEMVRQIRENDMPSAIQTARDALVLPGVLGYICPGLCEKGCRRGTAGAHGAAVAICSLHRHVAEVDLHNADHWLPACKPSTGKRIAIIGAGPAGLACAWELLKLGHSCTILDSHPLPGGTLRYGLEPGKLPAEILDAEVDLITRLGAQWQMGTTIASIADLRTQFDAVAATGPVQGAAGGVFISASATHARHHAVQAVADGKELAHQVDDFLASKPHAAHRRFAVRLGALSEAEMKAWLGDTSQAPRTIPSAPSKGQSASFTESEAQDEADRCRLCGCGSTDICALRRYSIEYSAEPSRYRGHRKPVRTITTHPDLVFEEGKCIACGLCVAIAKQAGEKTGLAFVGRGFDVQVAVPFGKELAEGLQKAAEAAAKACPTGAIHHRRP